MIHDGQVGSEGRNDLLTVSQWVGVQPPRTEDNFQLYHGSSFAPTLCRGLLASPEPKEE